MRSNLVSTHTAWPLLALLLLLGMASAATAQTADTFLIDVHVTTPVGIELHKGPLAVPDPILPNPAYEALAASSPFDDIVPVEVEDAPDGLYVTAPSGAPIMVAQWSQGLEQRRIAPVEYAANALDLRYDLPVSVDGYPATPGSGMAFAGRVVSAANNPGTAVGGAGVAAVLGRANDEALPAPVSTLGQAGIPAPYMSEAAGVAPAGTASTEGPALAGSVSSPDPMVAVLAAGVALLLLKLLLPLYHRFKKKTALDNPTRQKVYELLRDAPGSSAAELGEQAGLHVTTVKYHLDVLRRLGMVGEQMVDGRRRFYSYENGDRMEMLERALLDEPAARAVFQQIVKAPGKPFIEVAKALGMRKEHVHYHVQKLSKYGLISDKWEGGRRLLFPSQPPAAPANGADAEVAG